MRRLPLDVADIPFLLIMVLALALVVGLMLDPNAGVSGYRLIPRCHEDQVIYGIGDFEAGRYEEYVCGPAMDDFVGN